MYVDNHKYQSEKHIGTILRIKSSARSEPTYSLVNNIGHHKSPILLLESDHCTRGQCYDETCLTFFMSRLGDLLIFQNLGIPYQALESLYPRLPIRTAYPPLIPVHRRSRAFKFEKAHPPRLYGNYSQLKNN